MRVAIAALRRTHGATRRHLATVASPAAPAAKPAAAVGAATATPPPLRPGALWIWGKVDEHRMGMNVSHVDFGAKALAMGPTLGPTELPLPAPCVDVVCRASKTLALTADGAVYSWGTCPTLSLGHGPGVTVAPRPRRIEALDGIRIVKIAASDTTSAALSEEGEVFTWGWGGSTWEGNGGLGHGNNVSQPRPALVEALSSVRIRQIAAGSGFMVASSDKGVAYTWGNGEYGRCGNGQKVQLVPQPMELLASKRIVSVDAGTMHGLALTDEGNVWAWGKNDSGQLGVGGSVLMDLNTMEEYPLQVEVEGDDAAQFMGRVNTIVAGGTQSLAITKEGRVWQWGQRTFLNPQPVDYCYLTLQEDESDGDSKGSKGALSWLGVGGRKKGSEVGHKLTAVKVACGEGVAAAVDSAGQLFTWGKNLNTGMLGHEGALYGVGTRLPTRVNTLRHTKVAAISLGSRHAAAVTALK